MIITDTYSNIYTNITNRNNLSNYYNFINKVNLTSSLTVNNINNLLAVTNYTSILDFSTKTPLNDTYQNIITYLSGNTGPFTRFDKLTITDSLFTIKNYDNGDTGSINTNLPLQYASTSVSIILNDLPSVTIGSDDINSFITYINKINFIKLPNLSIEFFNSPHKDNYIFITDATTGDIILQ
jgi:hypothetical protein